MSDPRLASRFQALQAVVAAERRRADELDARLTRVLKALAAAGEPEVAPYPLPRTECHGCNWIRRERGAEHVPKDCPDCAKERQPQLSGGRVRTPEERIGALVLQRDYLIRLASERPVLVVCDSCGGVLIPKLPYELHEAISDALLGRDVSVRRQGRKAIARILRLDIDLEKNND